VENCFGSRPYNVERYREVGLLVVDGAIELENSSKNSAPHQAIVSTEYSPFSRLGDLQSSVPVLSIVLGIAEL